VSLQSLAVQFLRRIQPHGSPDLLTSSALWTDGRSKK